MIPMYPLIRLGLLSLLIMMIISNGNLVDGELSQNASTFDRILDYIFDKNRYRNRDLPTELEKKPTMVKVYMTWSDITEVDVRRMEFTVHMLLRQLWVDKRLAWKDHPQYKNYTQFIVSDKIKQKAWIPDLFFRNGKSGRIHTMTSPNIMTRVSPDGEVLYSQKLSMTFACQMALQNFPMDTQTCHIDIGSYGYTDDQLQFYWRNDSDHGPIKLDKITITEFAEPTSPITADCTLTKKTATGSYTCLNATFTLSRELGWWLASIYVPNILVVMMSWMNFWISLDAVPARVAIGLMTLLGTLTQASSVSALLPKVSYIKAIDVWTMSCIIFNIGVLIEFAVASNLARKIPDVGWKSEVREAVRNELSKWCIACQQQYHLQNPLDLKSYSLFPAGSSTGGMICDQQQQNCCQEKSGCNQAPPPPYDNYMRDQLELFEELEHLLANYGVLNTGKHADSLMHHPTSVVVEENFGLGVDPPQTSSKAIAQKKPVKISEIDQHSKILFPAFFILFNSIYWVYFAYLVHQFKS